MTKLASRGPALKILSDLHQAVPYHLADESQARQLDARIENGPVVYSANPP